MSLLFFYQTHTIAFILLVGILGLMVGSFLNVLIYRLPLMIQNEWQSACMDYLALSKNKIHPDLTLSTPKSHCPHCQHPISLFENIPLISYLLLKGKCRHCQKSISIRYPAIETACLLLSLFIACQFGVSLTTLSTLIFTFGLLALSLMDIDHQLLPDQMTQPMLWLGLFVNVFSVFVPLQDAVMGALAGYLVLWITAWLFKFFTRKTGMAPGDFKLLAMLGAWTGWQPLPFIILLSSLAATLIGLTLIIRGKKYLLSPIPFGPYLAIAGWISLILGKTLPQHYLSFLVL